MCLPACLFAKLPSITYLAGVPPPAHPIHLPAAAAAAAGSIAAAAAAAGSIAAAAAAAAHSMQLAVNVQFPPGHGGLSARAIYIGAGSSVVCSV
jgi:hypothetical protein